MNKTRTLVFASAIAGAMVFGGVLGATALAHSPLTAASAASSASPSPGAFKSNEDPTHEKAESAAQETAENNGTFHPGGPGGPGAHGAPNENATHEAGESATREAAENSPTH
ncbi:MAG: hypothetical protein ACHQ0J_06810 [Candidatus Dormibacterales bacterium]